jgi:hypothetical protein
MKDTNQLIADALRDIAAEAKQPMTSADAAWRAGRRRRVATLAVPAACVAAALAIVVTLVVPSTTARGPAAPTVPSVPTRLVSLTLTPVKAASAGDLATSARLLSQRAAFLHLPDTQARVVGPDVMLTGPAADRAQLTTLAEAGVLGLRQMLLWEGPSPLTNPTDSGKAYGNAKLVNHKTLGLFHKLDCTPKNTSTWKNQVGYASTAGYDNPDAQIVLCDSYGNKYALDVAKVSGTQITKAIAVLATTSNQWTVLGTLNSAGTAAFGHLTSEQAAKYYPHVATNENDSVLAAIAFVLDGNLIGAPLTNAPIPGGMFQLGLTSQVQARDLAAVLKSGPLPVDFRVSVTGAASTSASSQATASS